MHDVGGAIAWMGFDGILLDTEVEGQNWAWTGPGGLSTQALTNTLVASRAKGWVEALNEGAGFDVPIYTYLSLPQAAEFPGCYCQYYCAYHDNDTRVATAINNSVWPAFVYGMAEGTTAPIVNGDTISTLGQRLRDRCSVRDRRCHGRAATIRGTKRST